jgi:WD40 repeat protein
MKRRQLELSRHSEDAIQLFNNFSARFPRVPFAPRVPITIIEPSELKTRYYSISPQKLYLIEHIYDQIVVAVDRDDGVFLIDTQTLMLYNILQPKFQGHTWQSIVPIGYDRIVLYSNNVRESELHIYNWRLQRTEKYIPLPDKDTVAIGKPNCVFYADKYLIVGTNKGIVHILDISTGSSVYRIHGNTGGKRITAILPLSNGRLAVSSGEIKIYDMKTRDLIATMFLQHTGSLSQFIIDLQVVNDKLIALHRSGAITVWSASTYEKISDIPGTGNGVAINMTLLSSDLVLFYQGVNLHTADINSRQITVFEHKRSSTYCVLPNGKLLGFSDETLMISQIAYLFEDIYVGKRMHQSKTYYDVTVTSQV